MGHDEATMRRFEEQLSSKRGVLSACLLVLLDEREGHGYDLLTRLEPLGYDRTNPGRIYRALRALETAEYVTPRWDTGGVGPARRVYGLSDSGRLVLELASKSLRGQMASLDPRLARYLQSRLRAISGRSQSFEVLIETRLAVRAACKEAAWRKIERLLGRAGELEPDIRSTGEVRIQR